MNKEKKIIQIVVKIFIVLFIVGLIFGVIMGLKHKNREYYITDHEYLYDIAIYYLKEKENKERKGETVNYTEKTSAPNKEEYHFFADYDGFGITEKNDEKFAYMWILAESYYLEGEEIKLDTGYSMFFRFTFKDNEVVKYETPKDGSKYSESIKKMCPNKIMEIKVLNYESKLDLKKQVDAYYTNLKTDKHNKGTNLERQDQFDAEVLEVQEKRIFVKIIKDVHGFKAGSKVFVNILAKKEPFNAGDRVRITFNGLIFETYPPQIYADKIELIE
ncbi:MAG TPA: hypothetical protein PK139_02175 [bacterium]|jgi:hypothetical protein|nr:hypothetical protein [bacterium]